MPAIIARASDVFLMELPFAQTVATAIQDMNAGAFPVKLSALLTKKLTRAGMQKLL
jgi:hypothetical protein